LNIAIVGKQVKLGNVGNSILHVSRNAIDC